MVTFSYSSIVKGGRLGIGITDPHSKSFSSVAKSS